jgi:hypothetical protein
MGHLWRLWFALLALVFVGCGAKKSADMYWDESSDDYGHAESMEIASVSRTSRAPSRSRAKSKKVAGNAGGAPPPGEASYAMDSDDDGLREEAPASEPAAATRMVHYDGYVHLRVTRVEDGIAELSALAVSVGGSVERVQGQSVTLRVPVDRFHDAFAKVLALGEPLDKAITAEDVTDAFMSVDLRLRTQRATLGRLVDLLAKAEDEKEKLQLVKQIQRVSEDVDRLEAQVRALADLASRSRITVELAPREALAWQGPESETAEMAWIRGLSPFRRDIALASRKLMLDVPDGLVALDMKRAFVAESPDGARIWTHRVRNRPVGDTGFWLDAIEGRLGRDFASVARSQEGEFLTLALVDRGEEPFTWVIGVRVQGDWLEIVQAYFPGPAETARYGPAVKRVLHDGGGDS